MRLRNRRSSATIDSLKKRDGRMKLPQLFTVFFACLIIGRAAVAQDVTKDLTPYWSATMDGLYDWYEKGFNQTAPMTGLPHPGIINGQTNPTSTFLLQPYDQNNVLMLDAAKP